MRTMGRKEKGWPVLQHPDVFLLSYAVPTSNTVLPHLSLLVCPIKVHRQINHEFETVYGKGIASSEAQGLLAAYVSSYCK